MLYELTIIIPFYNAQNFVKKSLQNTLSISKKYNVEIIYVDNNSTDKSFSISSDIIKKINNIKIFKTLKKSGMGPGVARNLGVLKAKSKYILFLDIDDFLEIKYFERLLNLIKKNNNNFIYLNKKIISTNIIKATEAPYLEYNKKCLDIFFQNTNNMQSIAIIFDKKFLLNHKIKFEKNIYEDIFYIFKCHYYNLKKIDHFTNNIYIKINHQSSITNTKKSLNHVICKFNAFKNIELFLKKKLTKNSFKKLNTSIQYRWRGEFANEYDQIIKSSMNKYKKVIFVNYLKQLYKKKIKKDFLAITNKDKITKNILFNV